MKTLSQRLKAQIHIAKKDLGLDDETYREMLFQATGARSSAGLDITKLGRVVAHLKAKGWKPAGKQNRRKVSPKSRHKETGDKSPADKIRALWISMHKSGFIADGTEKALGAFCYRIVKKHSPDWLDSMEASTVIESLKKWTARKEAAQ